MNPGEFIKANSLETRLREFAKLRIQTLNAKPRRREAVTKAH